MTIILIVWAGCAVLFAIVAAAWYQGFRVGCSWGEHQRARDLAARTARTLARHAQQSEAGRQGWRTRREQRRAPLTAPAGRDNMAPG
jgi:hypothetical protein